MSFNKQIYTQGHNATDATRDDCSVTCEYDPQTGMPVRLVGPYSTQTREYTSASLLRHETTVLGGESFSSEYNYSMAGKLQSYTNVHKQTQITDYDTFGRPASLVQGSVKVSFTFGLTSRVTDYCVEDEESGVKLRTHLSYDVFGREIGRVVKKGEETLYCLSHTYGETGLVAQRTLKDNQSVVLRGESFKYDIQNRLSEYECEGTRAPVDEQKRIIHKQTFEFDDYDNISRKTTIFKDSKGQNTAEYVYSKDDPTQLIQITNSHADFLRSIHLKYDANGCLTMDEQGRKLEYDQSGRLVGVRDLNDKPLCEYRYDASGKLACQSVPHKPDTRLFYRGDSLIATKTGERRLSYVSDGKAYWGQIVQDGEGNKPQTQLWASDGQESVLAWLDCHRPDEIQYQSYTPYGFGAESAIAFNGQWRDPVTGWYHLGNGYRVYNPILMRFHSPDPWSPFVSGEVNPYAYCLGDPINRVDPSGHFSLFGVEFGWKKLIGVVLGIAASIAVGVLTGGASLAVEVAVGAVVGGVVNVVSGALGELAEGRTPTLTSVGMDFAIGFAVGMAGPVLGKVGGAAWDRVGTFLGKSPTSMTVSKAVNNSVWRLGLQKHFAGYGVKEILKDTIKSTAKITVAGEVFSFAAMATYVNFIEKNNPQTAPPSSFAAESQVDRPALASDSIRPLLKNGSTALSGYHGGQSVATVLNLSFRCSYVLSHDKQMGGSSSESHDSVRGTLRAPPDWEI